MDKPTRKFVPKSARLMDQAREVLCFHHYAYNTVKAYINCILQYICFHNKKHPSEMCKSDFVVFLTHLGTKSAIAN